MIYQSCHDAMASPSIDEDFVRPDEAIFVLCPENSVDYAIMEKTDEAVTVPLSVSWNDVGSWDALMRESSSDTEGNVVNGDVVLNNVTGSFVHAAGRLVSVVGLDNVVVVETKDAVLVLNKSHCQDVKAVVDILKEQRRSEVNQHVRVYRPWGSFTNMEEGTSYKVKHISVNPKQALSLQRHQFRAEHWVVVSGEATVTNGEKTFNLAQDKSTYIPAGTKHRLENRTDEVLDLIEVQTGSYLSEEDIERFSDQYGRVEKV
jgi:mannose-1-phosphate guanylyltransferase